MDTIASAGHAGQLFDDASSPHLAIAYTIIKAGDGRACPAKTFGVDASGKPVVTIAGGQPAAGTAYRKTSSGAPGEILAELGAVLAELSPREALVCVPPPAGRDAWPFVTKKEAEGKIEVISRSRQHFVTQNGAALLGLDFDIKAWPQELTARVAVYPGQLSGILASAAAAFGGAACLLRVSSSAGVRNKVSGISTNPNAGQHRFYVVQDGLDIERAVRALNKRLILDGWAYAFVSEAGHVEIRSLIDVTASTTSERLWFEGATVLADDRLEHVPNARQPTVLNTGAGLLNTGSICELTEAELKALGDVEAELEKTAQPDAAEKCRAWKMKREAALIARGVDPARAAKAVGLAIEKHELVDDFVIEFDDRLSATVAEIVAAPMDFHLKTGPDPLEPEYGGGRNKAILFGDANPVRIESQAHGGIRYLLRNDGRYFEPEGTASSPPATDIAKVQLGSLFDVEEPGPLDIFGDADPAELGRVPDGALPPLIERWVRTEARRKGVPPAFAAAAAVSAVGAAISSAIRIQVKRNDASYTEGSNLWTVLVADPGSAKSPIVSAAIEPLRRKDAEWARSDLVRFAEWEKASKRKGKDAPPAGPEPKVRRRLVDDITWEKLVRCFAGNPRLLRAPDEFQGMLDSFGAYKNGGGGDRSQFLRTFDGGPITYDRVAAGTIYADSASLAVLAGTQPDKMREVAKNLGSDGLLQRCLFVMHDGLEHEAIDERPDASAVDSYRSMLTGFLTADYHFPPAIRMDDRAGELFASSWRQIRTVKNLPGVGPAFRGHVMKWEKILSRLVLIFHCVRQFETDGRIDPEQAVDVETVERAVRFGRFLLRHAVRFYEIYFGATEAASEARWIAGHLLTKPELTEVRRRDLYSARKTLQGPAGLRLLLTAMAELEGAGWCRVAGARDADGPVAWAIDERIHSRFAERGKREKRERAERQAKIMQAGSAKSWINGVEPEEAEEAFSLVSAFD